MTNSYLLFITIFLNKFPNNNPKDFLIDDSDDTDINSDLDTELELLTMDMMPEIDRGREKVGK